MRSRKSKGQTPKWQKKSSRDGTGVPGAASSDHVGENWAGRRNKAQGAESKSAPLDHLQKRLLFTSQTCQSA